MSRPTPAWRSERRGHRRGRCAATPSIVGGSFTQLFTPSTTPGSVLRLRHRRRCAPQCARSTKPSRGLTGGPDGRGGLLVVTVGAATRSPTPTAPFAPPAGTTIVRIADDCLWDRAVRRAVDRPGDARRSRRSALPVPVGGRRRWPRTRSSAPTASCAPRSPRSTPLSGARVAYQFYPGVARSAFSAPRPTRGDCARARRVPRRLHARRASTRPRSRSPQSPTVLADETLGARTWLRGNTLYPRRGRRRTTRSRPTTSRRCGPQPAGPRRSCRRWPTSKWSAAASSSPAARQRPGRGAAGGAAAPPLARSMPRGAAGADAARAGSVGMPYVPDAHRSSPPTASGST